MQVNYSLIFLNSGRSTDGDIESVLFVGPMAPATYLFLPASKVVTDLRNAPKYNQQEHIMPEAVF